MPPAQLLLPGIADDQDARWHVRISRRARRVSVRVYPGGRVEIVVPQGMRTNRVREFVSEHRGWIERRVREFERLPAAHAEAPPERLELPAFGCSLRIEYQPASTRRVHQPEPEVVRVQGDPNDDTGAARALCRWLIRWSSVHFAAVLDAVAESTALEYANLVVRRQRTRWGSCSSRGMISVNVCLAFLRPELVRYLLLHELCHTQQMNHSRRFWALVERHEPRYRELDRELCAGWRSVPAWMFR